MHRVNLIPAIQGHFICQTQPQDLLVQILFSRHQQATQAKIKWIQIKAEEIRFHAPRQLCDSEIDSVQITNSRSFPSVVIPLSGLVHIS